ncbi:MAG TPA: hypothetical protein RMH99_09415, partial [Sandaracinaceae bacterium LLY-WYZ-13_1]|nr:hypothetical protein [Sandaracinaceae bacterium LLY-WYZ-13_1]
MAASTPPPTRDPASAPAPLPGVAGLADRPVDERRVAWVMAAVAFALAAGCAAMVEALLASADAEPDGGRMLRDLAVPGPAPAGPPGRAAVVVVDGLRTDEAWSIEDAARATVAVPPPTRTTPALHTLLTGVPPGASGVRSNRFAGPARHDTVADRVRAAGGRVFVVADGDDTLRALIGRPEDGGSDAAGSLGAPLDAAVDAWRRAPEPALLLAHVLDVDRTAHAGGVGTAAHRAALAEAREVVARVARVARAADAALFVLGDHGHLGDGGHGGPERAVARTPLAARAPGLAPRTLDVPVPAERLASTLATWLGVPRPRSAAGPP